MSAISWQHMLEGLGILFAIGCFLLSDWPRKLQHRHRWPREHHHSYFASTERDYAD